MDHLPQNGINKAELLKTIREYGITSEFNKFLLEECRLGGMQGKKMNMSEINQLCQKCAKKSEKNKKKEKESFLMWKKGEYKLLLWFLAFYLFHKKGSAFNMDKSDFKYLSSIFNTHTPELIEYQFRCLTNLTDKKFVWNQLNDQILKELTRQCLQIKKKIEWKVISFKMHQQSGGNFLQTPKQCRDRWISYCDPEVAKNKWTIEEEIDLLELIQEVGYSWAKIAKRLKRKRTDHMVKNHYNSMKNKWRKKNQTGKHSNKKQIRNELLKERKDLLCSRDKFSLEPLQDFSESQLAEDTIKDKAGESLILPEEMENLVNTNNYLSFFERNEDVITEGNLLDNKKEDIGVINPDILAYLGLAHNSLRFLEQEELYFQLSQSQFSF